jgi:hypothetical protein
MGVDSYMFDENSKECIYFDRRSNIRHWIDGNENEDDRHARLLNRMDTFESKRITSAELIEVCDANIADMKANDEPIHHVGWNETVKEFAQARPNGSFFMASDHDEYLSWDIIRNFGYKEIGHH